MRTLNEYAGRPRRKKASTQDSAAKYWGTYGRQGLFTRDDGTVSRDKTRGFHSRPGHKQSIRNANRSINKGARQQLKRQLQNEQIA